MISKMNVETCIGCGENLSPLTPAQSGKTIYFRKPYKGANETVRVCGHSCAIGLDAAQDYLTMEDPGDESTPGESEFVGKMRDSIADAVEKGDTHTAMRIARKVALG